ncbi:hypothetical protein PLICRDRAFT_70282, partial [Plicaturopsis crispa FD-325 SS-3]
RCFPHVVNISVQTGLKHLTEAEMPPPHSTTFDSIPEEFDDDDDTASRTLVTDCRASGQRRDALKATIRDGNKAEDWSEIELDSDSEGTRFLRCVALLRDVETRWSSTFLMIDRVLELYPAVERFLRADKQRKISHRQLSVKEREVLHDIRQFLHAPHLVQELVSGQKTPTLSLVLPMYEELIDVLRELSEDLPRISHAINASILKLEQYLGKTRSTRIYALAMG